MKLTSPSFRHNAAIPMKFTCQGEGISPSLEWADAPKETKSFALMMDDPDAPRRTWIHWLVKDIPAEKRKIEENSVPGNEVINSFGRKAYGGPCPPSGTHRYFFKLYALDIEKLPADNSDEFYEEAETHKLEEAVLIGLYRKS